MNDLFGGRRAQPKGVPSAASASTPVSASAASSYSAKDIEVLEGLEPVRRRPGMYIGGTDENALHHLAAEIIDNAMDEAGDADTADLLTEQSRAVDKMLWMLEAHLPADTAR